MSQEADDPVYKLCIMVPRADLETVKQALFTAGAGRYGLYDCCCWQSLGTAQFRPLPGSQPSAGKHGDVFSEETWKVEMLCSGNCLTRAIEALKKAHPYEVPAFDYYPVSLDSREAE